MGCASKLQLYLRECFFTYETPKMVSIESRLVGVMFRILQFILFIVVIVWIFIMNNGYQFVDNGAVGGSTTKLKGIAASNSTDVRVGERIWDAADLNIPPQDSGVFFVPTNIITTSGQEQAVCPDIGSWSAKCADDSECLPAGQPYHLAHGISTGKCNETSGYCMVNAWCPVENDELPEGGKYAVLNHTKDFTVFIKNHVYFPHFKKGRSNLIESLTKADFRRGCNYHPENERYCPIFRLGTIVGMAGLKSTTPQREKDDEYFEQLAIEGGVISIMIKWDCNFDYDESECKPSYEFARLDNFNPNEISEGYNFRYPHFYKEETIHKRDLVKVFGILFILHTQATARAFDTTTFLLNAGSSLALIGIASVVADIVLMNIHKNRDFFQQFKMDPKVTSAQRKSATKGNRDDGSEYAMPTTNGNGSSKQNGGKELFAI